MAYDLFQEIKEREHSESLVDYQRYGMIEQLFFRWLKHYEKTFLKIHNPIERKWLFSRVLCRFMEAYKKRLWKRYGFLEEIRWDLMATLTVDPAAFGGLAEEYSAVIHGWDKLRAAIRGHYGDFRYVRVLEIQKSGRPHLHILIEGIKEIPIWWIRDKWSKYGIGLECHIGAVRRKDLRGLSYVMKYVKKTLKGRDPLYASLLFASNRRQWGFSIHRRLNLDNTPRVIRKSDKSGWKFEGFIRDREVVCLCCRCGTPFSDVVWLRNIEHTHFSGLVNMGNTTREKFSHVDEWHSLSGLG